jgi:hypothetical protein
MAENHLTDYDKWYRWAYEQRYGKGSWHKDKGESIKKDMHGFKEFRKPFKIYWNEELSVGILEKDGKFIGVACLVAKEVVDKEGFVEKLGLAFGGDVHWKAAPVLLDHLSRSPMFKAVLVTLNKLPFEVEPDIPEELRGRLSWAKRNYEYHKEKVDSLKLNIEQQEESGAMGGIIPTWLPKQMKEEEDHARYFLESVEGIEAQIQERLKPYFLMKENLLAVALFLYVYTNSLESFEDAVNEILARKRASKIEANETYFVKCSDVKDPLIVFNPEFFPSSDEMRKYCCIALSKDTTGVEASYSVASVIRKMFASALELPTEEPIEEQIHIPTEEVSIQKPKSAFLGYVASSIIKKKVTKRRMYFPLDVLTGHGIIYGKTRVGKSFLSLILIQEALANRVKVAVFDPHGTLASRLKPNDMLEVIFTRGKADITERLEEIYREASAWPETNELKLLVVLDETRLLKAKNLLYCVNELGKRGVGFILVTQYSTSIPPEVRNVGTYFIMGAMSETEIQRFREVTLHPSSKLITRLPRAYSFVFSPYWYPEPFFIRHKQIKEI